MEEYKPLLSVLVPAYNAGRFIDLCIKSLLAQSYTRMEILICDDGSTDSTWSQINEFSDARLVKFKNASNVGKNETSRFLFNQSTGAYVTIHDADDISSPVRCETQMNFLLNNPEYAMCGTNFISFLNNGKIIARSDLETDDGRIRDLIKERSQFHGPTVVFKRSVVDEVGGLYRYFTRAEDVDFTMRVTEKYNVCNLAAHLYYYRHHSSSLTNSIDGYSVERLAHGKLLYHLAEERRMNGGIDTLMRGDTVRVDDLIRQFQADYESDPGFALRMGVFRLLDMHLYRNALLLAWICIVRKKSVLNFKCFIFSLVEFFRGNYRLLKSNEKIDTESLR